MLFTSLKIALKHLKNQPFFTAFNLFTIALTIACIMVVVIRFEILTTGTGTEKNMKNTLIVSRMEHRNKNNTNVSAVSHVFIEKYLTKLKEPEYVGIKCYEIMHYPSGHRLKPFTILGINSEFQSIFEYNILHGTKIRKEQVSNMENVALISEVFAQTVFKSTNVIGQTLDINGQKYIVQAIFQDVPESNRFSHASVLIPYTTLPDYNKRHNEYTGSHTAFLFHHDNSKTDDMKDEITRLKENINKEIEGELFFSAFTQIERLVKGYRMPSEEVNTHTEITRIILWIFLFMLLPALNLSALNLSRYRNRIEEVAIKRSFGANKQNISFQILWETIAITFTGGLAGIAIAVATIVYFAHVVFADVVYMYSFQVSIKDIPISMNIIVLFLITIFTFGILSGIIPALSVNKQSPAANLKGGTK